MNIVEIQNLSKKYHSFYAVDHVSLTVKEGAIYGLIGQNGAGKSTLMKLICGQIHESEGELRLFRKDPKTDAFAFRRIGALIENAGFYPSLNAYDNMKIKALAMGCDEDGQIATLLQLCGIGDTGKKKVKNFSLGMKQRLGIALALLGNPELMILDEPTNGLDPQGVHEIRTLLRRLNKEQGLTIIISSHILEELSKVATHYAIIKQGRILEELSKEELEERCRDFICLKTENAERTVAILEDCIGMKRYDVIEHGLIRIYEERSIADVVEVLVQQGIRIQEVYVHKQALEEYFLRKSGDASC